MIAHAVSYMCTVCLRKTHTWQKTNDDKCNSFHINKNIISKLHSQNNAEKPMRIFASFNFIGSSFFFPAAYKSVSTPALEESTRPNPALKYLFVLPSLVIAASDKMRKYDDEFKK